MNDPVVRHSVKLSMLRASLANSAVDSLLEIPSIRPMEKCYASRITEFVFEVFHDHCLRRLKLGNNPHESSNRRVYSTSHFLFSTFTVVYSSYKRYRNAKVFGNL
uniref:LIM zinc-binding domain-containing protein n=1 Tax=Parascaris univalens TaxID=6257 RepID=A0A915A1P2_PARUN